MSALDAVLASVGSDLDKAVERLFEVLRIKSISTDPAFAGEVKACADWHVTGLAGIGFQAAAHATPGHPIVVVAHDRSTPGPSALFYGPYDVHPVDPLGLRTRDPFDPVIETREDGTRPIRGRRAADDKGQVMTFIEACRAWRSVTGKLPIGVTILLQGEQETGGVNLRPLHAEAQGRAPRRHRPHLRPQHVGPEDAGDPDHAARPGDGGGDHPRNRPPSAGSSRGSAPMRATTVFRRTCRTNTRSRRAGSGPR